VKYLEGKRTLKILEIAPHPDDDIIACGGSTAKHLAHGNEVFVAYVTYGDAECPEIPAEEFTKIRKRETFNAARVIGLRKENLFFLEEKPWRLNTERVRFELLELVRQIRPQVCYIPHAADTHVDHRIVSQEAFDAINMAPSKWFRKYGSSKESFPAPIILAYEVWTPLLFPNYFEDITDFLEIKMKALREHKTQAVAKYKQAYRGMNAFRGAMHEGKTVPYAEAFEVLKIPNLFFENKENSTVPIISY